LLQLLKITIVTLQINFLKFVLNSSTLLDDAISQEFLWVDPLMDRSLQDNQVSVEDEVMQAASKHNDAST